MIVNMEFVSRIRGLGSASAVAALVFCGALVTALPDTSAAELDRKTAAAGIREALRVGAQRAVEQLGAKDGYLRREAVRIVMPERLQGISRTLRKLGQDELVDEFEVSLNRAAEAAAPLALDVFRGAIKEMSIKDALKIVRGKGHEATDYLRSRSEPRLRELYLPIVDEQLTAVGATRRFQQLMDRASRWQLGKKTAFDLSAYVTEHALDGLFLVLSREEQKIRQDPLSRTTDLLRSVFGQKDEGKKKVPWWKKLFGRVGGSEPAYRTREPHEASA